MENESNHGLLIFIIYAVALIWLYFIMKSKDNDRFSH